MNKEIYLIGGRREETYACFRDRMLGFAAEALQEYKPLKLWITLTESPPPGISVIPFRRGKIAAISVVRDDLPCRPYALLTGLEGFRSAYRVDEAIPVGYTKTWDDGLVTPGVCLLTLFRSRRDIPYETFIHRWHNSHTPLSLRIHPLWHYSRNVTLEQLAGDETAWGGIVEEHVRTRAELLNPFRFFGPPWVVIPRMIEVYKDARSFLDYKTIETWLVREYHLKS